MAKLTVDEVKKVAALAKLSLTDSQIRKFETQLGEIISYFDELKKVKTEGQEPTSQTTGLKNVTRKDEIKVGDCLSQEEALSGTTKTHNGYFVVDAVLAERSDEL